MGLINAIKTLDNINHSFSLPYGYCETAAGTTAKTVTVPNVSELTEGLAIIIRFKNSNTASSPTLNINGLGAKNIYRYGTTKASTSTTVSGWTAGAVQLFVYNGTGWVRDYWSNTTYTNAALGQGFAICETDAEIVEKTCSISSYALAAGGIDAIKFTNGNTASSPTLNITEKGAKSIYYHGAVIDDDTLIQPGDVCTFIYDSTSDAYHLLTNDRWHKDIQTLNEDKMDKNNPTGTGTFSMNGANATGTGAVAIGNGAVVASGEYSFASGKGGDPAHKLEASGQGSHAEGSSTKATGDYSHAEGVNTNAIGKGSHAEGYMSETSEAYAHAEGERTFALNRGAHAEGQGTSATGLASHAEGSSTVAAGTNSHAEGRESYAYGSHSHAEGRESYAYGSHSHAEGGGGGDSNGGSAYGLGSHAEGNNTNAIGAGSHAEGQGVGTPNVITLSGAAGATSYVISGSTRPLDVYVLNGCRYFYKEAPSVPYVTGYDSSTSTITLSSSLDYSNALENAVVKAFYAQSGALGDYAHVEGYRSGAMGNDAHAEGYYTQASGIGSHAEGQNTKATGHYSHAEGGCAGGDTMRSDSSEASGLNSHAEGSATLASDEAAHAEGYATQALDTAAHAEGYKTIASGMYAHSEGGSYYGGDSKYGDSGYSGSRTITITGGGPSYQKTIYGPYAAGNNSHAEGGLTYAKSVASHAEGSKTSALGQSSHAEGGGTQAIGINSHAEGDYTIASGNSSHAGGYKTLADGYCSYATGAGTYALGSYSHAEGYRTMYSPSSICYITSVDCVFEDPYYVATVSANLTSYIGQYVSTGFPVYGGNRYMIDEMDNYAKLVDFDSETQTMYLDRSIYVPLSGESGTPSNAPLYLYKGGAIGIYSHTAGYNAMAAGEGSRSVGYETVADGNYSHAEGVATYASGDASHVEGHKNIASGYASHAEGQRNKATGDFSHAEGGSGGGGFGNTASGQSSHAEGDCTTASGVASHAEGLYTIASGQASHAGGYRTKASGQYQTVIGKYNREDTANTYAFIVGNGTGSGSSPEAYRNAFTVDWSGNGVFKGGITASNFNGYTIAKSVPRDAKFTDTTYSAATTSAAGLMTADMVTKLNGIATGANKYSLPAATSSALGGVKIGSNISVSSGTISLTKSNVTSALGYTPTNKEFIFDTYSKSVTINPGDQAVTVSALTQRSGYTLLGYINQNGGYTDQWLISYGTYGGNVVAMVHSKYTGTLTQTISCTAIWYKNQ